MGFGFALGGAAKGLNTGLARAQRERQIAGAQSLGERGLALQEQQLQQNEQNKLSAQADSLINKHFEVIGSVIEEGRKAGQSPEQIQSAIAPLVTDVEELATASGQDPSLLKNRIDALVSIPNNESEGPFAGTGFQASSANILTAVTGKAEKGLPISAAERRSYSIAYQELTSPRVVGSPTTGFSIIQPTLDPSVFPPPDSIGNTQPGTTAPVNEPQIGQEVSPFGTELGQSEQPQQSGTTSGGATVTPLTPRRQSAEQAGRGALVSQGLQNAERVKESVVNPDGSINRDIIFTMGTDIPLLGKGIPGTEGRGVRSILEDSLASKLRLETGAQANPSELENIIDRFMPALLDNDETIADKMDRLVAFFKEAVSKSDPELFDKLVNRAAEKGNIPSPPPDEEGAKFQGFDSSSGVAVFKRADGTFFGIPGKQ